PGGGDRRGRRWGLVRRRADLGTAGPLDRAGSGAGSGHERPQDDSARRPVSARRRRRDRSARPRSAGGRPVTGVLAVERLIAARLVGIVRLDDLEQAGAGAPRAVDRWLWVIEGTLTVSLAGTGSARTRPGASLG